MIEPGSKVRHTVTGFKGTATGRAVYLSGCVSVLVKPPVDKDGKLLDGAWFDEVELEVTEAAPTKEEESDDDPPGGPRPEPAPMR